MNMLQLGLQGACAHFLKLLLDLFSWILKNLNFSRQNFSILTIHKPSLGSCEVPQKFGPDRFSRFVVYRIRKDKQTSKVYIDIQVKKLRYLISIKSDIYYLQQQEKRLKLIKKTFQNLHYPNIFSKQLELKRSFYHKNSLSYLKLWKLSVKTWISLAEKGR